MNPLTKLVYSQETKRLIVDLIRKHDVSTKALCEEIGLTVGQFNNGYVNNDKSDLSPLKIMNILEILGVSIKLILIVNEPGELIDKVKKDNILNR